MDLSLIQRCRLCLKTNENFVDIWETFQESSIASIVVKHFWFQVNKGDGLSEVICDVCWIQTKTFHQFYKQIEQFQKCFYDSVAKDKRAEDDAITYVDCDETVVEADVNIGKDEETELRSEAIVSQPSTHNGSEFDEVNVSDENDTQLSGDEEDQCSDNRKKGGNRKASSTADTNRLRLSPSEKAELEGQIRDLFKMNCEICTDITFSTLLDAHKHYRSVHQKSGYIMCCGRTFHDTGRVLEHIRYHIDLDATGEPEVEAEIREWFAMKCDICSDTVEFRTLLEMRRHFRIVHNMRGYLRGTCCGKKLQTRAVMLNHIRWHTNSDSLRCGQCDKIFTNKFTLKSHIANHTPHDSRTFNCTLCPSRFALAASLRSHVKHKHTEKTGEKFDCDRCTKRWEFFPEQGPVIKAKCIQKGPQEMSNYLLSHHIRNIHESTTEYVCEICAQTLRSKTTLQNHFDCFHSSKPPPKFQCDVCGIWLRSLRYHRLLHESSDPVNCSICNKEVASKRALVSHIKYVHGEKKHRCQLCSKAFVYQKNLKEHLATHTGQDLYDCPYCDKKFKSNANMHKHRKSSHFEQWTRDLKGRTMRKATKKEQPAGK